MEEVKVKIYGVDELTPEAFESALVSYTCGAEVPWIDENIESFRAFAEHLGGKPDFSIGYACQGTFAKIKMNEVYYYSNSLGDFVLIDTSMKNEELMEYLEDHFPPSLEDFSGYCVDSDLIGVVRKFMESPIKDHTLEDLLTDVSDELLKICDGEYEYFYSDEGFKETAECNGLNFTEDGTLWNGSA